jgi:hypothetical protein
MAQSTLVASEPAADWAATTLSIVAAAVLSSACSAQPESPVTPTQPVVAASPGLLNAEQQRAAIENMTRKNATHRAEAIRAIEQDRAP